MTIPQAPNGPAICFIVHGFMDGLVLQRFDMSILPSDFVKDLKRDDYVMPDEIWAKIYEFTYEQQGRIIYNIIRTVHEDKILYWLRFGRKTNPSKFAGEEYKVLPLELCGWQYFEETFAKIKPLLPRFALDKGNDYNYPTVRRIAKEVRNQFLHSYGINTREDLIDFIYNIGSKYLIRDFPDELAELLHDYEIATAIADQVIEHF